MELRLYGLGLEPKGFESFGLKIRPQKTGS